MTTSTPTSAASEIRSGQTSSAIWTSRLTAVSILLPLVVIAVVAIIGPYVVPFDPERVMSPPNRPPSSENWFGTDSAGLDVFSRTVVATRLNSIIALSVATGATMLGLLVGLTIGTNEARHGLRGLLCRGLGRVVDLFQAVPNVVIALVAISFNGASILSMVVVMALILAPVQARLVRTEVLRVRGEAYIDAGRIGGMSELSLTLRHILPNSARPALENAPVVFGSAVILAASLGFLGVGLPPPTPEWGAMIAAGASDAAVGRWWSALFPSLALVITVTTVAYALPRYLRTHNRL